MVSIDTNYSKLMQHMHQTSDRMAKTYVGRVTTTSTRRRCCDAAAAAAAAAARERDRQTHQTDLSFPLWADAASVATYLSAVS